VDELSRILGAYDRGTISRRRLLQALGVAGVGAAGVALPAARLFGQGQCAGRDKDTTAVCNKTLAKAPFKPTGWKTVLLDHFTMQVTDPEQEAAFYTALMSWKVRSNDSNGSNGQSGSNAPQNGQQNPNGRPTHERNQGKGPSSPTDRKLDDLEDFSRRLQRDSARRNATGHPSNSDKDW